MGKCRVFSTTTLLLATFRLTFVIHLIHKVLIVRIKPLLIVLRIISRCWSCRVMSLLFLFLNLFQFLRHDLLAVVCLDYLDANDFLLDWGYRFLSASHTALAGFSFMIALLF